MMDVKIERECMPRNGTLRRRLLPIDVKEIGSADAPAQASLFSERATSRFTAGQIKVVLADDHPIIRAAIARILEGTGDITVVAEVADGKAAIAAVLSVKPDVAVMDVNMPRMNGVKATRAIRDEKSGVKIIGLSIHNDDATRQAMLDAGACAYLLKDGPTEALIDTIRQCVAKVPPASRDNDH